MRWIIVAAAAALGAALLIVQLPEMKRYLKMEMM